MQCLLVKKLNAFEDFPDGTEVKNLPCNAGDMGSIPGQGTKLPCATQLTKKKKKNLKKELVVKKLQANKSTRLDSFTGQFYQTYKEELMPILLKLFQKTEKEGTLPNLFFDVILP